MKSPVSLALIVKNEPQLEKCLLSIKDYVSEIVIVDTGSTDGTAEIAKKYATIFEVYTECNNPETGLIEDFSQARNRSFELATQPWIMWCDGDDIIEGAEHLPQLIEEFEINRSLRKVDAVAYLFPYEYAYNENGQCILRHYRERLFSNKNYFKWVNPVHEVVIPNDNFNIPMIPKDEIVFKHQRQFSAKIHEPGRNLRILEKYYQEVGDSDPRQLYYLGLEYCNLGMIDKGIESLKKYIDISGWEDERVMACLKLVDIYYNLAQYESGLPWAFKSIEIKEDWCEGYLALSKLFYFIALRGGPYEIRNWQRCAFFAKRGLELPPTRTLLFINPLDRDYFSHIYLNFALNKLGDVSGALESATTGLKSQPNDKALITNKKLYENFLSRDKIVKEVNTLLSNEAIDKNTLQAITALINNQSPLELLVSKNNFSFEEDILLKIKKSANPLRIVFVLGDGVEEWTPETIKKTGIGGSELMAMEVSKRLAALGHKVSVYNSCGEFNEGIYGGVTYYQTHKYHDLECDVLIVSRNAKYLSDQYNITAKLKLLWVHDVFAINATNELLLKANRILALSQWHKDFLVKYHNVHPQQVIVTRNGINLNRFNKTIERNRFKCVNSSSPDRSWAVLLDVWPRIKEQVPQAELHLYYGFKNWEYSAQFDPKNKDLIQYLKDKISSLSNQGVVFHDRINQDELAKELLSSSVWTYPTWFSETSCITAMEMQAAGVRMVTSSIAALKETAGDRAVLLEGEWTSEEYKSEFVDAVVEKLTNEDNSDRLALQSYAKEHFSLDALSEDWESMFYSLMEEFKINPIIPYFPTPAYRTESSYKEEAKFTIIKQKQIYDPTISGQKVKLNIGAGPNIFPYDGWINYDKAFFNEYFAQLSSIATEIRQFGIDNISDNAKSWIATAATIQKQIIIYLTQNKEVQFRLCDVNEPFPQHLDNSVDIIYLGQMIEHLNPIYTTPNFLKECYRMLKPGGIIRLATPDLDLLINAYHNGTLNDFAKEQPEFYKEVDPATQLSYIMFGACGPNCTWDNYEGHMFLFNKHSMTVALSKAGFKNIEFFDQETISHNEIIKHEVTDEGWSHSLVVEGTK